VSLENDKTQIEDITRIEKGEKHTEGIPALKTFRGCKVLEELPARGGEADNYILECNGRKAFLKLYRKGLSPKIDLKRLQEISRVYKEHLVEIYDTGYDQQTGRYYEIMEYIEHGDLRNLLNQIKGKTIAKKEKIIDKVVSEIAEALNVLHKNNIIHRDLKPANILIRDKDKLDLVLTDFGIARALEEDLSKVQTTGFKGTTHYMAPEELSGYFGKEIDWWHLGVIVYELVFGKHPFEGLTDKVVLNALATKGVEIPQGVPEKYSLLLKGLLTKDYKKRWGYEQVKRWLSGDLNIKVYYDQAETKVEKDYEEKEWMKYGISKETNWGKLGLSLFETRSFIKAGFGFNDAKKWVEAGWTSGELAKRWYNAGFGPEESYVFENLGLGPKQARQIKNKGLTAYDLKPLIEAEGEVIEEFTNFIEENSKKLSSEPLRKLVEELSLWRKEGFTIKEAYEWIKYDFSIQEAKIWKVAGFDLQDAIKWRKLGFNTEEVKIIQELDLSLEEANAWRFKGFSMTEAQEWIKAGFDVESASSWRIEGFSSPWEASVWKEEDFEPRRAKKFVKDGFTPREAKFIEAIAFVVYTVSIFLFAYYNFGFNSLWLYMLAYFAAYFIGLYFIFPIIEWLIRKTIKIFKKLSQD
jgi:serine/threonine protein kinase